MPIPIPCSCCVHNGICIYQEAIKNYALTLGDVRTPFVDIFGVSIKCSKVQYGTHVKATGDFRDNPKIETQDQYFGRK